ncbi:MAG: S-layer homology domain-containing protein [Bifidobacterium pseudolongum]|jgi:hypothetical protein|nr:S-layer homology domain-containing protein [Bifidobacterium pseudolongum]
MIQITSSTHKRSMKALHKLLLVVLLIISTLSVNDLVAHEAYGSEPTVSTAFVLNGREVTAVKAGFNDKVSIRIHTKVPNYTNINPYSFIVKASLSFGLEFDSLQSAKIGNTEMKDNSSLFRLFHNGMDEFCFGRWADPNSLQDDAPTNIAADKSSFPIGADVTIEYTAKVTLFAGARSIPLQYTNISEAQAWVEYGSGGWDAPQVSSTPIYVYSTRFGMHTVNANGQDVTGATFKIYKEHTTQNDSYYFCSPTVVNTMGAGSKGEVLGHDPTIQEVFGFHAANWSGPYGIAKSNGKVFTACRPDRESSASTQVIVNPSTVYVNGLAPGNYTAVLNAPGIDQATFNFKVDTNWQSGYSSVRLLTNAGGRVSVHGNNTYRVEIIFTIKPGKNTSTLLPEPTFTDVNDTTPHAKDINWLADTGISTGYDNGNGTYRFSGMTMVYRQDMAAFLRRLAAEAHIGDAAAWNPTASDYERFKDVDWSTPHHEDILWLAHAGISTGYSDGTFKGMTPVYRQDMAAFLKRLSDLVNSNTSITPKKDFTDVFPTTPHVSEIQWLGGSGIAEGYRNSDCSLRFEGMTPVYRQDMAAFLHRLYNLVA